jgi:hypothetical protein
LRRSDAPPAPFGVGAVYQRFGYGQEGSSFAVTRSGNRFAQMVQVRDTLAPRQKRAILSCTP